MLDILVIETNRKMVQLQSMLAAESSSCYGYTRRINLLEVLALIGMIYIRGLLEQAHQSTNAMFRETFGNPVLSATMSRNRFKFLIAHISFNDKQRVLLLGNTIDLQLFAKFLKNLTKTLGSV